MTKGSGSLVIEPWRLREDGIDLDSLARTESLFALSNGHLGVRGNLDEGEPHGLPGTYLNSVFEQRPLPYAERGYGYPESGETIINVTNGKLVRLLVEDEPFDLRYGELRDHERVLDLRAGTLDRKVTWTSPAGQTVQVRSCRMVSLAQRSLLALRYEVTALDQPVRVVIQSELVANEQLPEPDIDDPRVSAALDRPLVPEESRVDGARSGLVHRMRRSGFRVAVAADHEVEAPGEVDAQAEGAENWTRYTCTTRLEPGQSVTLVKYVAYGWSAKRSLPALRDQVAAALTAARATGWTQLLQEQRAFLDAFWDSADVEVEGDPELQQAVRFGLFHLLQASARAERRPLPAKGLTGPGYDGHCFWDTEGYVLPVLARTVPGAAKDALLWRHATLPLALERAAQLDLAGAAFPWRTIDGRECGAYWPAGTAAFHLNADIAYAVQLYLEATGDEDFARGAGLELLVQTARLWRSLGHYELSGAFRIDGVTGPDEYTAVVDNNVFTNLMAQRNLRTAADLAARHDGCSAALGVDADEIASWRGAADTMLVPYDEDRGLHPQSENFLEHAPWNFQEHRSYPLFLHYPYFQLYRTQVVKQADLVLALHLCGESFTPEQKRCDFDYYEQLTVRDSSLSSSTQSVVAAEVGHLDLAYDYAAEAVLMDLRDLHANTRDGLHLASLAGGWTALVAGFGGLRSRGGQLCFAPQLPQGLDRLTFRLEHRGRRLRVSFDAREAEYLLQHGEPLEVVHHGTPVELVAGEPVRRELPERPQLPRPEQPAGRAPRRRTGGDGS